jgi:parvulin-like peptidyl-prolyl isomerase
MIFNKFGNISKDHNFSYDGNTASLVNEYNYLGIIFKPSGSFTEAINQLDKKASKAIFCIRKSVCSENKGNNKITELRTILQRESQNS